MATPEVVLLDSGPLGLVSHPNAAKVNAEAVEWLDTLLSADVSVLVPEISDYEVTCELLRAGRARGVRRRDELSYTISEEARREVLDRLLQLNHERYAEEVEQGLHDKKAKKRTKREVSDTPLSGFEGNA